MFDPQQVVCPYACLTVGANEPTRSVRDAEALLVLINVSLGHWSRRHLLCVVSVHFRSSHVPITGNPLGFHPSYSVGKAIWSQYPLARPAGEPRSEETSPLPQDLRRVLGIDPLNM